MAIYAIGDIQGCYDSLMRLLDNIRFDPQKDRLWFAGDLVNRGPKSLQTLRFVKALGDRALTVLGNHDLHLLAMSQGNLKHASKSHVLNETLAAKDSDEILHWLRQQPVMHHCKKRNVSLIHAGLPPQWSIEEALRHANELEKVIRGEGFREFCLNMYGNEPSLWSKNHRGIERLRFITNCFTRLRFCDELGHLNLKDSGAPGTQAAPYQPWFSLPNRKSKNDRIIFGHWSTLGYGQHGNAWSVDSGCLWGGKMTALRVRKKKPFKAYQVDCPCHKDS